jgi:hypothetical protein
MEMVILTRAWQAVRDAYALTTQVDVELRCFAAMQDLEILIMMKGAKS